MSRLRTHVRGFIVLTGVMSALALAPAASAQTQSFGLMAALGDSYTQGVLSGCANFCLGNSWSTGNNAPGLDSHFLRLRASSSPGLQYKNYALSGATVLDVAQEGGQAADARGVGAEYVTLLIGLNDYCGQGGGPVTDAADFGGRIEIALNRLATAKRVFVTSVFDATRLGTVFTGAPQRASIEDKCPRYNETGTRAVVDAYNLQIAQKCAARPNCVYDGGAVSNWNYSAADFSTDYFHLSVTGQRNLAALTFPLAFPAAGPPNPPGGPGSPQSPSVRRFAGCPAATVNVILGTSSKNSIAGTRRGDRIFAGAGNDSVGGLQGNDCMDLGSGSDRGSGGTGNDLIRAGSGRDVVDGGSGRDRVAGGTSGDRITGGSGNDRVGGGPGNDPAVLGGSGNDRVNGESGSDRLSGGTGRDLLAGNSGNDTIHARDGARDRVSCGSGRDTVVADAVDRVARDCERVLRR